MSYKVRVTPKVKGDIASWQLPRPLLLEVYSRLLTELPSDPDKHLKERIVPLASFAYQFTTHDPQAFPHRRLFVFAVDRHDDISELHVVGARMSTEAGEEN